VDLPQAQLERMKAEILAWCTKQLAKYSLPYDIEFRTELPKTRVGKVAYTELEKEELAKIEAAKQFDREAVASPSMAQV
jgi:long-chain acyl-CoA synthetase